MLDGVDRRIVELLTFDGRASNRSLAAETGLTEATVGARLRKLREQRVLHVTAVFDWWMLGYEWEAFLHIGVEGRSPRAVARELGTLDAVHAMSLTLGSADLIVHVLAVDRDDLRRLVTDRVPAVPGVARLRTDVVLELASMTRVRAAMTPGKSSTVDLTHARIDLDQLDRQLIDQLVDDGRRSNREIARQLASRRARSGAGYADWRMPASPGHRGGRPHGDGCERGDRARRDRDRRTKRR